ncbi:DUF397 domain-containing protein [Actinoallomurus vinaceus]
MAGVSCFTWRKSSKSDTKGDQCVEVAMVIPRDLTERPRG